MFSSRPLRVVYVRKAEDVSYTTCFIFMCILLVGVVQCERGGEELSPSWL